MKIFISCQNCYFPGDGLAPDMALYGLPVRDDNVYTLICRRGHRTTSVAQEAKFETLFEIALSAIVDGYYRDAIASATASLERFYEFVIAVICDIHKINRPSFDAGWKSIQNQSERQLGAYIFSYVIHFGVAPMLLPQGLVELRNKVIHKGKIPEKEEAIEYLNATLGLINPTLLNLKKDAQDSVTKVALQLFFSAHQQTRPTQASTIVSGTLVNVSLSHESPHATSIHEKLRYMESMRYRG